MSKKISKETKRKIKKGHKSFMITIKEIEVMMEIMIKVIKIGVIKGMITKMIIEMTIEMIIAIIGMIIKIGTIEEIGEMEEKEEETIMEMIEIGTEETMKEETIEENGMGEIGTIIVVRIKGIGTTMVIELIEVIINITEMKIEIKIKMVVNVYGMQIKSKESQEIKIRMFYLFKKVRSKFMKILIID